MADTILIIEDNEQNLYMMRFMLEKRGFTIVEAPDGKRGLEIASRLLPDIIILDIQLPGMDGYTVSRKLREIKALAGVPIVAVTSYAMVAIREGYKCGSDRVH